MTHNQHFMYRKNMPDSPIAEFRKRQRPPLTQDEFGAMINGVDGMTVSRWERGENPPSGRNLRKLMEVTGLTLTEILSANVERAGT